MLEIILKRGFDRLKREKQLGKGGSTDKGPERRTKLPQALGNVANSRNR